MNKHPMTKQMEQMQDQLALLAEGLTQIEEELNEQILTNHQLRDENAYLREKLQNYTDKELAKEQVEQTEQRSKAMQNLANIYEDGFHICNISYGQRRPHGEQCMFCLDILAGKRDK